MNKGSTLIIAEAGVNHNGYLSTALELVDAAHRAGADVVKFQTYKAKNLVTASARQAPYQVTNTGKQQTQIEMLSNLELSYDEHQTIFSYCKTKGIEYLSTAFDTESLDFLVNGLNLTRLKIPSGDLTNAPFLLEHAITGCDLILSTGMSNLDEIRAALGVLAYGLISKNTGKPDTLKFQNALNSTEGQTALKNKVSLLHCTTEYPTPASDVNLLALDTLSTVFNLPVGYSDHTLGSSIAVAAVARGACILEKHFTLDSTFEGPDHRASIEPDELKNMVVAIRNVELALGSAEKKPQSSELENIVIARKSLVAASTILKGQRFSESNISVKRPGMGQSPFQYWNLLGKRATKTYNEGDLIAE